MKTNEDGSDELDNVKIDDDGPYQTNPPSPDDIISSIQINREERKPRKDRGMRRGHHSTSSSTFNQPSSSHINDDDDDDDDDENNEGTSHASTPSLILMEFPLPGEVSTASEESSHCQKKRDTTAQKIVLVLKSSSNYQSNSYDSYANKYKTAQELWAAILKTFGGNEATKKTKKNLLKQQYGNFKAEGSETLEQTFNRLQGNEEVNTASISTASTTVSTASANIGVASISQDTAYAYIASQSSGSQIKFKDINQIDKDDMEEVDIKWNMALLSIRANRFWKKISIQGTNVAGFDKLNVECFNCHKTGHFARKCRAARSQDRGRRDNYRQGSKVEEQAPKALMEINEVGWDWSYMANDEENHALIADEETPTEFALMAKTSAESEVFDNSLCSKACKKNSDSLNRLPECADDTVTDYSRHAPTIESFPDDAQNRNPSVTKTEASPSTISLKPFIKFVKANDSPTKSKTDKVETAKKPPVKYAEQYRKPTKKPNVIKSKELEQSEILSIRKFSTVNRKFPTANKKFPTGSTKISTADMGKKENAVKASAAVPRTTLMTKAIGTVAAICT
nr:hypothetical protein [Tanacetum cinerariifolium]